jgi:hypothetical protein
MKKKTIFKVVLALPALVAVVVIGMVGWIILDLSLPNYGWEFGNYGQFNRVQHVIEDMPNVSIVDHWQHQDVSLEDFGFTLMVDGNRKVGVTFSENSHQMRLRNKKKIKEFIQKEMDSNKNLEHISNSADAV